MEQSKIRGVCSVIFETCKGDRTLRLDAIFMISFFSIPPFPVVEKSHKEFKHKQTQSLWPDLQRAELSKSSEVKSVFCQI